MRYITVRVVESSGRPRSNARIGVWIYQTLANGMKEYVYTNSEGEAHISLDIDEYAEISISVDGDEKVRRGKVKAEYHIVV